MDDAVRARVAGKEAMARRTAWLLEAGQLRVRCVRLRADSDVFVVQLRDKNGWHTAPNDTPARGVNPYALLLDWASIVGKALDRI